MEQKKKHFFEMFNNDHQKLVLNHFLLHLFGGFFVKTKMVEHRRKAGEKTTLLGQCGELLFGCSGETLVTQGIYTSKSMPSKPFSFICKRTVWVPDSQSIEHLTSYLEAYGARLPFSISKIASLHRFGLCGLNPTRTVHARDTQFLLLAKYPTKRFAVYGVVVVKKFSPKTQMILDSIITNKDVIQSCMEWVKNEPTLYQLSRELRNQETSESVSKESVEQGDQPLEPEVGRDRDPQIPEHNRVQCNVDTESDSSFTTPEYLKISQLDSLNYSYFPPCESYLLGMVHTEPSFPSQSVSE